MRLLLILLSTIMFLTTSTSVETSDPSWLETTKDQSTVPSEDVSSTSNYNLFDAQTYPAADEWNLLQESSDLGLAILATSCNDHADETDSSLIGKLRIRAHKTDDTCSAGTINSGERGDWGEDDVDDIYAPVVDTDTKFPILVFPDVVRTKLSPSICDKYSLLVMNPVCDSGIPPERTISLIFSNPLYPMYKLDNCFICMFTLLLSFSFFV